MRTHFCQITIATSRRSQWVDMTSKLQDAVTVGRIAEGVCIASSVHTTAGITINENADPAVQQDFFRKLESLVPQREDYQHAEGNSDSHLKASLVGFGVQIPVHQGRLVLGTWQAVYFCEFDGPRERCVAVMTMGQEQR